MVYRVFKYSYWAIVHLFALTGLVFVGVFIALQLHLTDVPGNVDLASSDYQAVTEAARATDTIQLSQPADSNVTYADGENLNIDQINQQLDNVQQYSETLMATKQRKLKTLCSIVALAPGATVNAQYVWRAYQITTVDSLVDKMVFAVQPYLQNNSDYNTEIAKCNDPAMIGTPTIDSVASAIDQGAVQHSLYPWVNAEEWPVLSDALVKDSVVINRAATDSGSSPRLIATMLVVEQLRLYHTQREYYEKFFAPLKILANATQFAWGVMSIKEAAAKQIEQHLTDTVSPYYLGEQYAHSLDFTTGDISAERFNRLSNEHDHYYSYLYGGLYLKQFITQWRGAGYDISDRPEIIATLFNLGFEHSNPKADPQVGGSTISIGGRNYSFGALAYEFYYSGELMDQFPY